MKILAVDTVRGGLFRRSSVGLAVKAAKGAIAQAQIDPNRIGLLVSTGIYRDRHTGEPAIAAFIQKEIEANPDLGATSTFAFDLMNAGCGAITGLMTVEGFLASGAISHGLIVSADAEPVPGQSDNYPFSPAAAAILVEAGSAAEGFVAFHHETYPDYIDAFSGRVVWQEERKRSRLILTQEPSYASSCAACAADAAKKFLAGQGLTQDDLDLVLTSSSPAGFIPAFREISALGAKVFDAGKDVTSIHTAGIVFVLQQAIQAGAFAAAHRVLFVTVGAGITVAMALYVNSKT